MFGIGMPELLVIFVLALLIFGPKELPKIGRTIGRVMGEFRRASDELRDGIQREIDLAEREEQSPQPSPEQPVMTPPAETPPPAPEFAASETRPEAAPSATEASAAPEGTLAAEPPSEPAARVESDTASPPHPQPTETRNA